MARARPEAGDERGCPANSSRSHGGAWLRSPVDDLEDRGRGARGEEVAATRSSGALLPLSEILVIRDADGNIDPSATPGSGA